VDPRVARRRQDLIGRRLRRIYEEVVEENVPQEFLDLLGEADGRAPDQDSPNLNGKARAAVEAESERAPRTVKT
jgi:hypothetical protein